MEQIKRQDVAITENTQGTQLKRVAWYVTWIQFIKLLGKNDISEFTDTNSYLVS